MEYFFYTGLIFFGVIAWVNQRLGLYVLLALLPTYLLRTQIFGIPTTWLELGIYVLFFVWVLKSLLKKNLLLTLKELYTSYRVLWLVLLVWLLSALLATIMSPDLRLSAGVFKAWWFDALLLSALILTYTRRIKHVQETILSLLVGASIISLYGLIEYIFGFGMQADGLLNAFYKPGNYVALFIVPIIILSFPLLKTGATFKKKIMYALLMGICVIALWYTKSFGGFLGLAAGASVLFMFLPGIKLKYIVPTFLLIGVIGILVLSTQPKFKNIVNGSERNSLTTRLQIWEISIEVLKQHPIFGVGLGNFQAPYRTQAYKMYQPPLEWEVVKAHNLYLNLWLEVGLLGLLTFFGMLLVFAWKIKKLLQSKSTYELWWLVGGTLGALISMLAHGLLDTPFFKNDLSILFLFVFCLPFILNKIKTQVPRID